MLLRICFLRTDQSHVYADPSSIASVASLVHHPETVQDFGELDQQSTKQEVLLKLCSRRYRLDFDQAYDGTERYAVISLERNTSPEPQLLSAPDHPSSSSSAT